MRVRVHVVGGTLGLHLTKNTVAKTISSVVSCVHLRIPVAPPFRHDWFIYGWFPFQDMRFDDSTKAELHLRCEELGDALWTETVQREEAALNRLVSIRGDGKNTIQPLASTDLASPVSISSSRMA